MQVTLLKQKTIFAAPENFELAKVSDVVNIFLNENSTKIILIFYADGREHVVQ
jgi:hypothetical protein